jgi:hypothetical protein
MSDLVMRLETAAAKCDVRVRQNIGVGYPQEAADMRELLQEAARRIKELEQQARRLQEQRMGRHVDPEYVGVELGDAD